MGNRNREGFLEVLSHLYRRLRRYRICLYVDGAGWHKGAPVQQFLRTHPRLRLHYLPSYQPALNLQERIWQRIRYEATTNRWFATLEDTWDTVQRTTRAWTPQKLQRLCNVTYHVCISCCPKQPLWVDKLIELRSAGRHCTLPRLQNRFATSVRQQYNAFQCAAEMLTERGGNGVH